GDTGNQLTTNVKKSYRIGVELTAGVHITDWLQWEANCVLSRNKIKNHTETITLYDHFYNFLGTQDLFFKRATIAFSPTMTGMSNLNFHFKHFDGSVQTHFVSKQYLDNTQNESAILHPYTTTNLNLQYQIPLKTRQPNLTLRCQINNVFNAYYASNGGNDGSCFDDGKACWPWFYAQSGINVHAGFIIKW
ncbi:MAG: TonB-dependent receptor, partial [Paludibacteraceae bacterium]|nr:TonB-dependent receptor [Paludibacteraceae bacterium]